MNTETYSDSESESDEPEDIIDIIDQHIDFLDIVSPIDMVDGNYYIGCYTKSPYYDSRFIFLNKIHRDIFMKYNGSELSNYFNEYSVLACDRLPLPEIIQLTIDPIEGIYEAIIKTFWIRLIQRAWKRVYKKRQEYIYYRKQIAVINKYQLIGNPQIPFNIEYPGLYGLLVKR